MPYSTAFSSLLLSVVILRMILLAGDSHPNPGSQTSESSSSFYGTDLYNFMNLTNHYNVQSIANNLDALIAEIEFSFFDIVSFPGHCLHNEYPSDEFMFPSFHPPERKDRVRDR